MAGHSSVRTFSQERTDRETTYAGFGCEHPVPGNHRTSEYGRWQSHAPWECHLHSPGLHDGRGSLRASQLKRSNVRAIVLCNAPHELASGAVAFFVDHAACPSRGGCGRCLQAPLIPRIPVLLRLCALPNCCVHSAVCFVYRLWRDW